MAFKKILLTVGLGIAVLLLLIWTTLIIFTIGYSDKIKAAVIAQLNKQLITEVSVKGNIDFSLFKNFPFASVTFNDVTVIESLPEKNNLLEAKKISLLFNIWNLLRSNYTIEQIVAEQGGLSIRYDASGNPNYNVLKSKGTETSEVAIKIKDALLKNFYIHYANEMNGQHFSFQNTTSSLKGDFSSKKFLLEISAEALSEFFKTQGDTFLAQKKISVTGNIDCDFSKRIYEMKNTKLSIEGTPFYVSGRIFPFHEGSQFDLKVTSNALQLQQIISWLPTSYKKRLNEINAEGNIDFSCNINGVNSSQSNPVIKATFKLKDGTIGNKNDKYAVEKVSFNGSYSNGDKQSSKNAEINISTFKATIGGEYFSGSLFVRNPEDPFVKILLDGKIHIQKLLSFFKTEEIKNADGEITLSHCYYSGKMNGLMSAKNISTADAGGKFILSNVRIETQNSKYDQINGTFEVTGNQIAFSDLNIAAGNSDLNLAGNITNLMPFMFSSFNSTISKQKIGLQVSASSKHLQWQDFLGKQETNETGEAGNYPIPKIFYQITGSIELSINELVYQKFTANDLHGKIIFLLNQIYFSNLGMKAEKGTIDANGKLNIASTKHSVLNATISVQSLNITQLFYEFDNFGQSTLTDKNLKGKINASISLQSTWDNNILNKDKLHALADVTVSDGELNNFDPMLALSIFVKVNELKNIQFSQLQNQIEISNQVIYIPSMKIFSNALNVELSGTHNFNNVIDYKVQLSLLRLLTDRFKKSNPGGENGEQTTEGFLNLYLSMKGEASNPEIKYDKHAVKQKINADLAKEKLTLKETLKKEFSQQEDLQHEQEKKINDTDKIEYFEFESDTSDNKNNLR